MEMEDETHATTLSRVPQQQEMRTHPIDKIPNEGIKAWFQVVGSFFLFFNSWGIVNTFGVFQTYYGSHLGVSDSSISWVGSVQAYLLMLVGTISGPLFDAGYLRLQLFLGAFLLVFGMMMTSISTTYWQIMLSQGVCVGIGCGCLFVPSVAIISQWFTTKKAFATGIAASGSSLGGIIYPIVFHRLQPQIGFQWASRVLAFIVLCTLAGSIAVMRIRITPAKKRALVDLGALHEAPFLFFTIGMFFGFMGLYIPFFYIQTYAIENDVHADTAFYLLSVINAGSILGRVIPNFLADRLGPINVITPGTLGASIIAFTWIGIKTTPGLFIFCVLYGFFSGSLVSIPPTVIVTISPHLGVVGTRMGMAFALSGLGTLVGTPIAGLLIREKGFVGAIVFCGASVMLAAWFFLCARIARKSWKIKTVV